MTVAAPPTSVAANQRVASVPHDFQDDIDAVARIDAVSTILDVICRITGMGFAAVARVTEDRWIVCSVLDRIEFGLLPGGELKVATTICNEIRQSGTGVVIDHVAEDTTFCGHPTPAMYGFQSYISMPIVRRGGEFFGTLCAIDPRPARLNNPEVLGMFRLFAELIAAQLDADERLLSSEASLRRERELTEFRDQFIAVLGHDLRNPIAALDAGTKMLMRSPLDAKATTIVTLMQGSVLRMSNLIDNLLDFARGRLGSGIGIRKESGRIEPVLTQVIDELRAANPDRVIRAEFNAAEPFEADQQRLGQMFSNLLGNALTHGVADGPIDVSAWLKDGIFELSVANGGKPIEPAFMAELFRPFVRGRGPNQMGLGLGLYIASEIAQAHGGSLVATSDAGETRFTFRMPVAG